MALADRHRIAIGGDRQHSTPAMTASGEPPLDIRALAAMPRS